MDYETLHKLPRLRAALNEALRLVPPLPIQVRRVHTNLGSYSHFIVHFSRLRDPDLVGEFPTEFHPERFFENENLETEVKKTFGSGHSPCLGKEFALTETRLLVASLIMQGSFELVEGDPSEVIREAGAHLSPGLKIRVHLKED